MLWDRSLIVWRFRSNTLWNSIRDFLPVDKESERWCFESPEMVPFFSSMLSNPKTVGVCRVYSSFVEAYLMFDINLFTYIRKESFPQAPSSIVPWTSTEVVETWRTKKIHTPTSKNRNTVVVLMVIRSVHKDCILLKHSKHKFSSKTKPTESDSQTLRTWFAQVQMMPWLLHWEHGLLLHEHQYL